MFNHRPFLVLLAVGVCLILVSGAAAADPEFSAASTPTHVKPSTAASYTITLTSSADKEATRAVIEIPPGFVDVTGVTATASATPPCLGRPWNPAILSDGSIELQASGGNPSENGVCPGGTLTVTFTATSAATENVYTWITHFFRDTAEFTPPPASSQPTVVVDGTPPTVEIADPKPGNPSNTRTASFTFSASAPTQCKLDAGAFTPCSSPAGYTNLSDGPHAFTVQATDAAGNTASDGYSWTVETRSPTAALSSGPAGLTNTRAAAFVFSADEPSRFECQLDGGAFLPCSSPAAYQGLADGAHTFAVRPIDGVGNVGAAVSRDWRIDATAPETRVASGPRSRTTSVGATLTFAATEQASFQCKLDAAAFAPCVSPKSYSRLRRSAHTFQVRGIDPAGNVDPTPAVFRWTVIAAVRRVTAASALLTPQAGARVTSPPTLVWRRVSRASYYNVQLYRGTRKILSAWPVRTRFRLRARWTFGGRQHRLVPGTYRWYVWPRIGSRYGKVLGQSTFIVRAPARG